MFGAIVVILSLGLMWHFLPRKGQPHPWMALPFFETGIPLLVVIAFATGLTMVLEHTL